jgi:hypothetical protein
MGRVFLVIFLFTVVCSQSLAQKNFVPGMIVTLSNDTIRGSVLDQTELINSQECHFRDTTGKVVIYYPNQILAYRYGGNYYVSKQVKIGNQAHQLFAEYLLKGERNLYYLRGKKEFNFFTDLSRDTIVNIPYKENFFYRNGIEYRGETTLHKDMLKAYFKECPGLFPFVDQTKKPTFNSLLKLSREYADLNCSTRKPDYIKDKPRFHFYVEPIVGVTQINDGGGSHRFSHIGANLYFPFFHKAEHWFIKTGVTRIATPYVDGENALVKIPLQVEYMFYGRVRPKFDLGLSHFIGIVSGFHNSGELTISASAGLLIPITKNIYYDATLNSDFLPTSDSKYPLITLIALETGLRVKF